MHFARTTRVPTLARCATFLASLLIVLSTALAGQVTYETDPTTGRLMKATFADGSYMTYSYDANGNRMGAVLASGPDTTPPSTPTGLSASAASQTQIAVSWNASTDNVGVTNYRLERCQGSTCSNFAEIAQPTGTSHPDAGLNPATTYRYRVRAIDAANNLSGYSNIASATTTVDSEVPSPPGTPSFSSITETSATAIWGAASDNVGVTGYQYSLNGGAWTAGSSPQSLSGLSPWTTYSFQVRAGDAAGNWGPTSVGSFKTRDDSLPSAPGTPSFTSVTHNSASANWSPASDNVGVTGYQYRLNGDPWIANSSTSVSLTSLAPGTSYSFEVRATDAAGNFGNASSGSFTTIAQITISGRTVSTRCGPHACTAVYVLTSAGDILATQPTVSTTTDVGDWLAPKTGMSDFQARATGNCSGSNGTWGGFSQQWTKTISGPSGTTSQCSFVLEFRHSANPTAILGTATIVLRATVQ